MIVGCHDLNEISYYQYGHGSVGSHEIEFMNLNEKIC